MHRALPRTIPLAFALLCASPAPASRQEAAAPDTPLLGAMKAMEEASRDLRRALRRQEPGRAWELVVVLEQRALESKSLTPPLLERLGATEGGAEAAAAALEEYRKEMVRLLAALLELERAILERDFEEAAALYRLTEEIEAAGHEKFMPDE